MLDQIGFKVSLLDGGYREFRRAVVEALDELPRRFEYRVVCGTTGSGKSRLLPLLAARGAQVLDLERLANHRGSVLGLVPGSPQPSQKAFDTRVWDALRRFDAARPVWIESESKNSVSSAITHSSFCLTSAACREILEDLHPDDPKRSPSHGRIPFAGQFLKDRRAK